MSVSKKLKTVVINTPTPEIATEVIQVAFEMGYPIPDSQVINDNIELLSEMCLRFEDGDWGINRKEYYIVSGFEVITAQEFLK